LELEDDLVRLMVLNRGYDGLYFQHGSMTWLAEEDGSGARARINPLCTTSFLQKAISY
ncbi:hypothetical protein PanWU01x14_287490, partial [Parasponia andersonii]